MGEAEGDGAVSRVLLHELDDPFERAHLHGKLVNIGDDIRGDWLPDTSAFRQVVSGRGKIHARHPYERPFEFYRKAKMFFSANMLPKHQGGPEFLDRFEPIRFLFNGEPDPRLIEKLTTPAETSGILNWALEGYEKLLKGRRVRLA